MIKWQTPEKGFYVGFKDGVRISISEHWTGFWLDGLGTPIVCGSIEEAKKLAEQKVKEPK